MARPQPEHKKATTRVQISARLAKKSTWFARTFRDQELFQLVESLLERELRAHGIDPFANGEPVDAATEGKRQE